MMKPQDESNIPIQNNECDLRRLIVHEFVVVFITYYTFDIDLMHFCTFML